jgi:predicted amidohydrolase
MARIVRVAAAQYPLDEIASAAEFGAKLSRWVEQAAASGAQLLVFPEYAGMELARIAGRRIAADMQASIEALQSYIGDYETAFAELSRRHDVFILAGSAPTRLTDGRYVNQARLFGPRGGSGFQQKNMMTRFEAEKWGIGASSGLCVFDIGIAKVGIAICYDAEFPLIPRALAEAGADILLAPSCTDSLAGYYRVRHACAARALENQIYTVQVPVVGEAPWCAAMEVNIGAAGFFAPPERRFPADGVLALGKLNEAQWVYCDLDLDLTDEARKDGDVLNARNWDLQPGAAAVPRAKVITLE